MTQPTYVTSSNKRHPAFILAVDTSFFENQLIIRNGGAEGLVSAFSNPINIYPHELFLQEVQSHLVIREREYLDNGVTTHEARRDEDGKFKKGDPSYKQILPYLVARQEQDDGSLLFYPYRRTSGVGESRLAGNGSIGYGGHVDLCDLVFGHDSIIDLYATIIRAVRREAFEEFTVYDESGAEIEMEQSWFSFGNLFIVDNSNAVGELHLGLIMHLDIPKGLRLVATEDELAKLPAMTAEQMLDDPDFKPENWTKIYLECYLKCKGLFGNKLQHLFGNMQIDHGGETVGLVEAGTFSAADLDALEAGVNDQGSLAESQFAAGDSGDDPDPYTNLPDDALDLGDEPMGDHRPYSHYATADLQDLPISEIANIDPSEFPDMDADQLLAFRDEHILAMSHAQVATYRAAMIGLVNGANWRLRQPTQEQKGNIVKQLDRTSRLNEAEFADKVREAKTPTNEKEAILYGRGGLFAPEGTPDALATLQNQAATSYHESATERLVKSEVKDHFVGQAPEAAKGSVADLVDAYLQTEPSDDKTEVLKRVDAAQDAQAMADTPYPPLSQAAADQIAKDVTGDATATFEGVINGRRIVDVQSIKTGEVTAASLRALSESTKGDTKVLDSMASMLRMSEIMAAARDAVRSSISLQLPPGTDPQPLVDLVLAQMREKGLEIPSEWTPRQQINVSVPAGVDPIPYIEQAVRDAVANGELVITHEKDDKVG